MDLSVIRFWKLIRVLPIAVVTNRHQIGAPENAYTKGDIAMRHVIANSLPWEFTGLTGSHDKPGSVVGQDRIELFP